MTRTTAWSWESSTSSRAASVARPYVGTGLSTTLAAPTFMDQSHRGITRRHDLSPGDQPTVSESTPTLPPPDTDPDISRTQVLDIYRQVGDQELRRHVPILQTDGKGYIAFLCCGQGMSHDRWWIHIQTALKRASKR